MDSKGLCDCRRGRLLSSDDELEARLYANCRIPLRVTVSGSFRKHLPQIALDVTRLTDLGAIVLSPADPRVVDAFGEFLFVASDHHRTLKRLQDRHVASLEASAFLWLVNPDGYVGPSAALEIGAAVSSGVPIYSETPPSDLTIRQYVDLVPSVKDALDTARHISPPARPTSLLISPAEAAELAHDRLEQLQAHLTRVDLVHRERDPLAQRTANSIREALRHL